MEYGFFGIIILALDIWAIYNVLTSTVSTFAKILWTIVILALPVLGFIAWLIAGPKGARTTV